jgi:hypothetical protein
MATAKRHFRLRRHLLPSARWLIGGGRGMRWVSIDETYTFAAAVGQRIAVLVRDGGDGVTDTEVVGQPAYTLREERGE